jgi:aspartyl-tRNA(Asn)/glutamyl-tRNA(Gln) amidotransferase subunit A
LGLGVKAVDYLQAFELRAKISAGFEDIFGRVSVLIAPATPVAAPMLGTERIRVGRCTESLRVALIRGARTANFTGLPAVSLPCGFTRERLPIGMQLIAGMGCDSRLLRVAFAYEQATEWHLQHPANLSRRSEGLNPRSARSLLLRVSAFPPRLCENRIRDADKSFPASK